jgi:hypothetical protein
MDLTKQQLNILRDLTDLRSSVENTLELMEARTNIFLHTLPRLGGLSATPGWFKMQIYDIREDNELSSLSVQVAKRLAALLERERHPSDELAVPQIDSGFKDCVTFTWQYDNVVYSWLIEPAILGVPNVKITQVEVRPNEPAKANFIFDFYTALARFQEITSGNQNKDSSTSQDN